MDGSASALSGFYVKKVHGATVTTFEELRAKVANSMANTKEDMRAKIFDFTGKAS